MKAKDDSLFFGACSKFLSFKKMQKVSQHMVRAKQLENVKNLKAIDNHKSSLANQSKLWFSMQKERINSDNCLVGETLRPELHAEQAQVSYLCKI